MSNRFYSSNDQSTRRVTSLREYLRNLTHSPLTLASLLAILIIPIAFLVWWYYSVAMALGSVTSLQSDTATAGDMTPAPQAISPIESALPQDSESTTSTDINTTIQSDNNGIDATVRVNDQPVAVPESGSTHQVIEDANGTTSVDISVGSNSSGTSKSRSSINIDLDSSSRSQVDITQNEER